MSTTCPRHPKVETNLTCASCGIPICPRCTVVTPVGFKCNKCGSQADSPLFKPSMGQLALAAITGIAAGAIAGWAVQFSIGIFTLFLALIYGAFAGEMILRASGRKRGVKIELATGVSVFVGALGARLVVAALLLYAGKGFNPPYGIWTVLTDLVSPSPIPFIALIIVIASALSKIRHLW